MDMAASTTRRKTFGFRRIPPCRSVYFFFGSLTPHSIQDARKPIPPSQRKKPTRRIGHDIQRVSRAVLKESWSDPLCGERPNQEKPDDFRDRGDAVVRAQTELSFHPEKNGNRRRQKKDIGKPTPQGRVTKYPTLQDVERSRCDTERVGRVSEPPHSKAVIAIPVPSARANLRKRTLISFCYKVTPLFCKGAFIPKTDFSTG